jgi:ankyrin repeat protein
MAVTGKGNPTGTMLFDFMLAAWGGKCDELEATLQKYPDANGWRDEAGGTALRKAIAHGSPHLDAVTLLLDRGANVNAKDKDGMTPLMFAALHQEPACAALLLARGADTGLRSNDGRTASDIARRQGAAAITDLIVRHLEQTRAKADSARRRRLATAIARMHKGLRQPLKVQKPLRFRQGFRL